MEIKTFKVTIGGFTFKSSESKARDFFYRFLEELKNVKDNLRVLHIHTANLEGMTLKDF